MQKDRIEAFKEFLTEKCNAEEVGAIIHWIHSPAAKIFIEQRFDRFKENKDIPFESDEVFSQILDQVQKQDLESMIYQTLEGQDGKQISMIPNRSFKSTRQSIIMVAASILIMLLTFLGGYYANDMSDSIPEEAGNRTIRKSTENGQKLTFYLNDGTMVKLNANSTLEFPVKNSANRREVWLDGEAYFEVTENPTKPFTVHTSKISTTALGTSFTVRAFDKKPEEVFLLSGKVDVRLNDDPVKHQILRPGESTLYNVQESDFQVDRFDPNFHTAWKDGILAFEKSPYYEVIESLQSWYGVKVKVEGEVPKNLYSSSKFQNDYFHEVMRSLAYSWGFEFELNELKNEVIIEFIREQKSDNMEKP